MASDARGEKQVRQFGGAMLHQLQVNKAKGDWHESPRSTTESIWQVMYHTVKLMLALGQKEIDPIQVQEYCADVGNEAMITADLLRVLDSTYQSEDHTTTDTGQYDEVRSLVFDFTEVLIKYKVLPEGFDHDMLASEELVREVDTQAKELLAQLEKED